MGADVWHSKHIGTSHFVVVSLFLNSWNLTCWQIISSYHNHAEFKCQQTKGKGWEVKYFSVVGAIPTLTSAANVDYGQLLVQFFLLEIC